MELTQTGHKELEELKDKVESRTASPKEMEYFLDLISGYNKKLINKYINGIGFSSIDQVKKELNRKKNNQDLITGLVIVGYTLLISWSINR